MMTLRRSNSRSAFYRGDAGLAKVDQELAKAKKRMEDRKNKKFAPFRFLVKSGETRQGCILDDKPDFFMYEHSMNDERGRWGRKFCGCVAETEICPACIALDREAYYAMMLTLLDFTQFKTKSGENVEFSRKLVCVKLTQQRKFLRFYEKEGSLRGAVFDFIRDGEKSSSIGNDIEFVEWIDEKELKKYVRSYTDFLGNKITEDCSVPFVYEELFEEPTVESIRAIVGSADAPNPGSREHEENELGTSSRRTRKAESDVDDWEDDTDDTPFDKD